VPGEFIPEETKRRRKTRKNRGKKISNKVQNCLTNEPFEGEGRGKDQKAAMRGEEREASKGSNWDEFPFRTLQGPKAYSSPEKPRWTIRSICGEEGGTKLSVVKKCSERPVYRSTFSSPGVDWNGGELNLTFKKAEEGGVTIIISTKGQNDWNLKLMARKVTRKTGRKNSFQLQGS